MSLRFLTDTRSSTILQFYIQLGEGPLFVITQHRHLAGQRLLPCNAQSSDRCLSDTMFGLTAGNDAYRIPSAGTPLAKHVFSNNVNDMLAL